jgi:hypothetical protein
MVLVKCGGDWRAGASLGQFNWTISSPAQITWCVASMLRACASMCEQVTLVGVEPLQDSLAVVDSASFTTPTEAGHAQLRLAVVSCNKVSLRPFAARLHRLYFVSLSVIRFWLNASYMLVVLLNHVCVQVYFDSASRERADLWRDLGTRVAAGQVDAVLHLGDQIYADSDFYLAQNLVCDQTRVCD